MCVPAVNQVLDGGERVVGRGAARTRWKLKTSDSIIYTHTHVSGTALRPHHRHLNTNPSTREHDTDPRHLLFPNTWARVMTTPTASAVRPLLRVGEDKRKKPVHAVGPTAGSYTPCPTNSCAAGRHSLATASTPISSFLLLFLFFFYFACAGATEPARSPPSWYMKLRLRWTCVAICRRMAQSFGNDEREIKFYVEACPLFWKQYKIVCHVHDCYKIIINVLVDINKNIKWKIMIINSFSIRNRNTDEVTWRAMSDLYLVGASDAIICSLSNIMCFVIVVCFRLLVSVTWVEMWWSHP